MYLLPARSRPARQAADRAKTSAKSAWDLAHTGSAHQVGGCRFRERRKEKMMSMEKTIANLEQHVLQLRTGEGACARAAGDRETA